MTPEAQLVPLRKARQWSKVRVEKLGLLDTEPEDALMMNEVVVVLGDKEEAETFVRDPETAKPIKLFRLWSSTAGIWQLGGDAVVREVVPAQPAGHPREISKQAIDNVTVRPGNDGPLQFQNGLHDFIWDANDLYSAVVPLEDAESAVETLLYAIPVAPVEVLPQLYAALARNYENVLEFYEAHGGVPPTWDGARFNQANP